MLKKFAVFPFLFFTLAAQIPILRPDTNQYICPVTSTTVVDLEAQRVMVGSPDVNVMWITQDGTLHVVGNTVVGGVKIKKVVIQ